MKRVVVVIAIVALGACSRGDVAPAPQVEAPAPPPVAAPAPPPAKPSLKEIRATCKSYGEMAREVMRNRQEGAPMDDIMGIVVDMENAASARIGEQVVIAAYEQPRMSVAENKQRLVDDFSNQVYLDCIKRE